MSKVNEQCGSVIVSWSFSEASEVMLIGVQSNGKVDVINGFTGEEVKEIFEKLTGLSVEEK